MMPAQPPKENSAQAPTFQAVMPSPLAAAGGDGGGGGGGGNGAGGNMSAVGKPPMPGRPPSQALTGHRTPPPGISPEGSTTSSLTSSMAERSSNVGDSPALVSR